MTELIAISGTFLLHPLVLSCELAAIGLAIPGTAMFLIHRSIANGECYLIFNILVRKLTYNFYSSSNTYF